MITLSGSLAYDHLLDTKQKFLDCVPKQTDDFNMSIVVNDYAKVFGGTAGNIAYFLHLLGESSTIVTAVGNDGGEYLQYLQEKGINIDTIYRSKYHTASAYITTDPDENQIISFYPGALKDAAKSDIRQIRSSLVCLSANGDIDAMRIQNMRCIEKDIPYVFDPGQMINTWNEGYLRYDLQHAAYVIVNQYEYEMLLKISQWDEEDILALDVPIIVTLGDQGSRLMTAADDDIYIHIAKPDKILNPTGCGDAFRAGVLYAIAHKKPLTWGMKLGTVLASFALETLEPQNQLVTIEDVKARFEKTFAETLEL